MNQHVYDNISDVSRCFIYIDYISNVNFSNQKMESANFHHTHLHVVLFCVIQDMCLRNTRKCLSRMLLVCCLPRKVKTCHITKEYRHFWTFITISGQEKGLMNLWLECIRYNTRRPEIFSIFLPVWYPRYRTRRQTYNI